MATTIDSSGNPLAQYGYDQKTGQALADSLGITTQQLAAAFAQTPATGGSAPTTTSYGMTTGGQRPGRDLGATVNQLQIAKAAGMGGGNQTASTPASTSASGAPFTDEENLAGRMGAAALGRPQIVNPTPGQITSAKGGVSQVASPVVSSDVPTVPSGAWNTTAGVYGDQQQAGAMQAWAQHGGSGNPADAAAIEKQQGWAPGTIAKQFGSIASTAATPASGGTPTPMTPANAASASTSTPFATAPAAPSANASDPWAMIGAHNSALENAGKALYAHFGGDPSTASHQDIMGFHNALSTAIAGGAVPGSNYTAGVQPGISAAGPPTSGQPPVKMATGGWVTGNADKYKRQTEQQSAGQQGAQWQPPANLPASGNLVGWTPSGAPQPSPRQFQGMPANLPGISGGVPAFGSAPVTPPPLTLPPTQGQQGQQQQGASQWQPPSNLPASGNLVGWTPSGAPPPSPMQFQGLPANLPGISGGPPAFGSAPVTPPPLTLPPRQMQSGGMVPGRGNQDTVPALLTPGEYVIPKQQAAQMFGGRTPVRMESGGFVPDDQEKKRIPPEVRRGKLTPPGSPPPAPGGQGASSSQDSGQQGEPAQAQQTDPNQGYWSKMVQQAQAQQALGSGGASGGGYNIPGGGGYIGASPGAGESGYIYPSQSAATAAGDVGTGGGPTGANAAAGAADIAGGLMSGLAKAAQTYAASIKPWQVQKKAFGNEGTPNYQNTNFQQDVTV